MSDLQATMERLALSRERLREAMHNSAAKPGGAAFQRANGSTAHWLDGVNAIPGASIVIEAVRTWWARHPLRITSMVAAEAATAVVQPLAQSNPVGLVLGAALLGGLFAWSRPWRWIITPALFAGLLPQIFSKAMASVPAQSWMAVLAALTQEQNRPTQSSTPMPAAKNA